MVGKRRGAPPSPVQICRINPCVSGTFIPGDAGVELSQQASSDIEKKSKMAQDARKGSKEEHVFCVCEKLT